MMSGVRQRERPNSPNSDIILEDFHTMDRKFRRACQHIRILNRKIEFLQVRYDRAFQAHKRSFRYTYRLQLATLEGMRNMYYEYACRRADELEVIQDRLMQHGLISDASDMSDDDDDDDTNF